MREVNLNETFIIHNTIDAYAIFLNEENRVKAYIYPAFDDAEITSNELPWLGTEYNSLDYKYENGVFVLDPLPTPIPQPTEIERLRADVDYLLMIEE